MKIRFYKKIDGWRWTGFIVAMIGTFIPSSANVETQWMGWSLGSYNNKSCSIWVYFGWKDGDTSRALMELMHHCPVLELCTIGYMDKINTSEKYYESI